MITVVDQHRVRHGDIQHAAGIAELMQGEKADIFYCDPPWGLGLLKYFQTLNHKQTGAALKDVDLDNFMHALWDCAKTYATGPVIIEYGRKWRDMVIVSAKAQGLVYYTTVETLYHSGSNILPMDTHLFGLHAQLNPGSDYTSNLYHSVEVNTPLAACRPWVSPGGIILDPCCGLGITAKAALRMGMRFRGNELNASRLAQTVKQLRSPYYDTRNRIKSPLMPGRWQK